MPHTPALDDLARRVRGLEDRDALHALMVRGWRALGRKDWRTPDQRHTILTGFADADRGVL
ncbi:hypothetical protein ACFP1B_18750, partial [Streptomyces pulveraceus]